MNRILMNSLLWGLLAFVFSAHTQLHAGPKVVQALPINIRTYAYVRVSPSALAQAKQLAARILGRAGIQTVWVDCHIVTNAAQEIPVCDQVSGPQISDVNIYLADRFPPEAKLAGARTLGFAVLPEEGGFGDLGYISLPNVEKFRADQRAPLNLILGLVLAHEIGHLLLGLNEHAATGIMRACWDKADLQRAQVGRLQFTAEEANLLRTGVLARRKRRTDVQISAEVSLP
jgi:hypothetical protein